MRRRPTLVTLAVAAGLALAGCSGGSGDAAPDAAARVTQDHNDADVAFARGMIPHHGQALAMARMAPDRAASEAVKDLAERIEAAQGPEIEQMSAWLEAWGEDVPDPDSAGATEGHGSHGMDEESHAMGGMLTADEMAALEGADGEAWDELFLTGMIAHHEGAVAMAEEQLAAGSNPQALELAQAVIDGQSAEIEEMRALLAGETPTAAAVLPGDVGHIHGIGTNPADGLLYLGTHHGLYVLDGGQVTKVGDAGIDLMGFAVAGPDHFYASGHPGPDDDLPNPVGLIETRDGGTTWEPVSLTGQSDFHALAGAGQTVVGFDGTLRTSTDGGRTWADGDDVRPAAVAVSPDGETVLATTEQGPRLSTDGGATFELVDGAPVVVFAAWTDDRTVWAVDPGGVLHVSDDAGATWERRGETGSQPQAITAGPGGVTVATATSIVSSADGTTFTTLATG